MRIVDNKVQNQANTIDLNERTFMVPKKNLGAISPSSN